jgi:putative DNA primase/helicase
VSVEVTDGTRLAEGLVKTLTGGDHVAARFLYERTFEFLPQFKLCIAANNRPTVRDDDDAMWRRLVEIPFPQSLPEEERDPSVKATLMDPSIAGPAILAWAAEGAASWFVDGLGMAEEVDQATKDYRAEMDPLREFWRERCVFDPAAFIASRALYAAYDAWVAEKRIRQSLTRAELRNRLHAKGCQPHRTTSLRGWKGFLLRAGSDPLDAEAD